MMSVYEQRVDMGRFVEMMRKKTIPPPARTPLDAALDVAYRFRIAVVVASGALVATAIVNLLRFVGAF